MDKLSLKVVLCNIVIIITVMFKGLTNQNDIFVTSLICAPIPQHNDR
jgi:hypothetical protein